MDGKNMWIWIVVGLAALWFFFLRKKTTVTGGANVSIATGNQATPYNGYPPGYAPPGAYNGGYGYGNAPPPATPIIVQQGSNGDSTQGILTGVGSLLGGLGSAAGNVLGALGNAGVFNSGGGSDGGYSGGDALGEDFSS